MTRKFMPATGESIFVDDLDFTAANQTIRFKLDGITYELALSRDNVNILRSLLSHFIRVSRIVHKDDIRRGTTDNT